jgi:septal ring factor EnvC (AmiA/AmiB activator)
MEWLKSKTAIFGIFALVIMGVQGYALISMRSAMDERFNSIEEDYAQADDRMTMLASDLSVVTKRMGVNAQELQEAQAAAKQLKQENAQLSRRLRTGLAQKADSKSVMKFQQDATNRMNSVQQEATTKIDGITGEVHVVRTDLDTTRTDLKATRADLNATREEVANSRRELGTLIARNSTELAELRRKGERDYVEFDIRKSKEFSRIGDVLVQLKKTDVKRQKYEVVINADDSPIQKKDRTANEPVTFLVGRDRVRYELVVNYVDKDRIRGYISAPKDKLSAAETPVLRVQ